VAVRFRTRKHLALLIRLAVEPGRPLTRDYLMDLLWADAPAQHARHSLAQAITVLRHKLGRAHVLVHKATVALDDVVAADIASLDGCTAEVAGPFLDGFEVPRAPAFELWKDATRARLLPRVRDCLVRHMDGGRRLGDFTTVERHAEVLLDLDPHSEDAVRGLMEARAWVGDRSNALKVYARFEERLREDLDAKPSAPLARVAHLLREGRPAARPDAPGEPAPKPEKPFRAEHLVGREREFSVMYDAWLAVRQRHPRILLIMGDPGVGKTTLTNAFAATCQMEGAVVARAQAYDAERDLPFAVLAELMRQLTDQRAIGAADPEALSELTRVCPDIYRAFPGVPKPAEWSAEVVPLRLAQAFWRTVEAAAEDGPLVLVVDDIHAADNASAAVLHVLARKLSATRVLLVLSGRRSELRATPAPAALVSDTAIAAMQPLDVEPLPPIESERLLRELAVQNGTPLPNAAAVRMLRASNGNPLALALLAREWTTQGRASLVEDLDRLNTQPAATLGIPRAIATVFERQRQRLSAEVGAALDLAAVLGRRLADVELYEVVGLAAGAAAEALSRLREEGILREVQGSLEFRNELIRAQAYYAVPAPPRQHLHRRVGEWLSGRADGEALLLETAWHFLRGGDQNRGRDFGMRGAEAALAVGAPHEAEQMLEVLVGHETSPELHKKMMLLLAEALLSQSKATAALGVINEVKADATLTLVEAADATRLRATSEYLLARDDGSSYAAAAVICLEAARASQDGSALARALLEFGRSGVEGGDMNRVTEALRQLDVLARDDRRVVLPTCYAQAYCLFHLGRISDAKEALSHALQALEVARNPVQESRVLNGLASCQLLACETRNALATALRALELTRRVGDESRSSLTLGNIAAIQLLRGHYDEALASGTESIELAAGGIVQPFLLSSYLTAMFASTLLGRRREAEAWFEEANKWVRSGRSWRLRLLFLIEVAEWELARGNLSTALKYFQAAQAAAGQQSDLIPFETHYHVMEMLWMSHEKGARYALLHINEKLAMLRNRAPLTFLTAACARATLEVSVDGVVSRESAELLSDSRWRDIPGRRALLQAEGLYPTQVTDQLPS
jgi:DNA-binding SARP family transcriptional activator/tetratricopeptide (TPR) repeat protein